jgi:glutathione peroxidase
MEIYTFKVKTIDAKEMDMSDFRGNVLLIVNVASRCLFTKQYDGLEKLHKEYKSQNFSVLGFPCNQFGEQEPGDEAEIKNFCEAQFGVTFPLFAKIDVKGKNTSPLFDYLRHEAKGFAWTSAIKWNFTKFLVDRNGKVIRRYGPQVVPAALDEDIKKILAIKPLLGQEK